VAVVLKVLDHLHQRILLEKKLMVVINPFLPMRYWISVYYRSVMKIYKIVIQ